MEERKMENKEKDEIILNYDKLKNILNEKGNDYFLKMFNRFSKKEFYNFTESWIENKNYILKLKGSNGDLIVCWGGNV